MKKYVFLLFTILSISSFPAQGMFSYQPHWKDDFNKNEKEHLLNWIRGVGNAVEKTLGTYPFEIQIYFHRSTSAKEPVPWAHTSRTNEEAVHFYVNPQFSLEDLFSDWTAAHEIAHLSIPFLGQEYSWFAEGFASYFQWQIMHNQGVINKEELNDKYKDRLASTLPKFNSNQTFVAIANQLRKRHDYPSYYYGGACYFIQSNQQLKEQKDTDLAKVVSDFQLNGRLEIISIEELINRFDSISKSELFSNLFQLFLTKPANESICKTYYH